MVNLIFKERKIKKKGGEEKDEFHYKLIYAHSLVDEKIYLELGVFKIHDEGQKLLEKRSGLLNKDGQCNNR